MRRERTTRPAWDDLKERVLETLARRLSEPSAHPRRERPGRRVAGGNDAVSRAIRLRAVGLLARDWKEAEQQ